MQHYLFYLAYENQNTVDYVTEKLWGPLQAGVVPVYYGAPNVLEHVPNHSIINARDYSVNELAELLTRVASSRELYDAYHAWRTKPLPTHFHQKYDFTRIHSTCRTCQWAYARLYGMQWDATTQTVSEVQRKVCLKSNLLKRPVVEHWSGWVPTALTQATCDLTNDNRVLRMRSLSRTVWEHDGVVDIVVLGGNGRTEWRLTTPLQNPPSFQQIAPGHYRLQDTAVRYTFLVKPKSTVMTADGNAVVVTPNNLRLRLIVEQVDTFHQGADQEENYFGEQMIHDFFHPVQAYVRV
jgi:hypothetical protein